MMPTIELKGDKLVITIDVSKKSRETASQSKTGKSRLLANTGGFVPVVGTDVRLSVNAIIPL